MTDQDFALLVAAGEQRNVEFKSARGREDATIAEVVRAVLGMSNSRDGGSVVIGIDDNLAATGLSDAQMATWGEEDLQQQLDQFADPYVVVRVQPIEPTSGPHDGKKFVLLQVAPFDTVPVICRKDVIQNGNHKVRKGALYVRPHHMPSTIQVSDHAQMRELIDLATEREVQRILRAVGVSWQVTPAVQADDQQYLNERAGFDE